jgi:hypothetical protein
MKLSEFKEELDHDVYDMVYEVLRNDYDKLLQCFEVWIDTNRYFDERTPEDCNDFYDWNSLIYCTIENSRYTQHLFDFNLE